MEQIIKIALSILAATLWIIAIRDVIKYRFIFLSFNLVWLAIIILFPIFGAIAYFVFGKNLVASRQKRFSPNFKKD